MRAKKYMPKLVIVLSALLTMSCLLPGMIPLKSEPEGPMPVMETDPEAVIAVLRGEGWQFLQALAPERYSDEDYAKPGTHVFTAEVTDNQPVYFNYGWCAVDQETLRQNFEHIEVKLYFNDVELDSDVVHNLTYTSPDNLPCLDFGVLMSEWPDGEYKLKAVATFDEKINDGMDDYDAGDYVFEYNVTVNKEKEGV